MEQQDQSVCKELNEFVNKDRFLFMLYERRMDEGKYESPDEYRKAIDNKYRSSLQDKGFKIVSFNVKPLGFTVVKYGGMFQYCVLRSGNYIKTGVRVKKKCTSSSVSTVKPINVVKHIDITPPVMKPVVTSGRVKCSTCNGTGWVSVSNKSSVGCDDCQPYASGYRQVN